MIDIKTQTKRTTKMINNISNVNLILKDFQIGIRTTESWGDFKEREIPLIEMTIKGINFICPLDVFINHFEFMIKNYKPQK